MKAVVVAPYYYPKIGGLENYARQLNLTLQTQHDWEIVVATSNASLVNTTATIDGQRVYRLGTWFKLSNTPFSLLWPRQIRRIIREEKPDIILAHAPVPSLADAAVRAKGKTPFIVIYHAATIFKQGSPLFNMAARIYNLYGRATLRRADRIWAVSDFVKQQLPANLQPKTSVLPNAVHLNELASRRQPSRHRFVFIASLDQSHAWKGLSQILQAVAFYRDTYNERVELTVVGAGTGQESYEKQAAALGITKNVRFTGALIGRPKTKELRRAMALLIYPTTANDAFPTVMLEAWSQEVPVIAAAIGPMPSLIEQGRDGFLCEAAQPEALAAAMDEVAQLPTAERQKVAQRARRRVAAEYTWEHQARRATQLAGELL